MEKKLSYFNVNFIIFLKKNSGRGIGLNKQKN